MSSAIFILMFMFRLEMNYLDFWSCRKLIRLWTWNIILHLCFCYALSRKWGPKLVWI